MDAIDDPLLSARTTIKLIDVLANDAIHTSEFIVERSLDGVNYSAIGNLAAKNQMANTYNYTDQNLASFVGNAKAVFYRLKISDKGGMIKYSEVARILLDKDSPLVTVGPNPFNETISVYSNETIKSVALYDLGGKQVFITSSINGNKINLNKKLSAGVYIVKIETGGGMVTKKLVKKE